MIRLAQFTCDGCGACCCVYPVIVSEADAVLEPRIAVEGKRAPHDRSSIRLNAIEVPAACCFLDKQQRCDIYDTRPRICREFAAGGQQCQEARVQQGIPLLESSSL